MSRRSLLAIGLLLASPLTMAHPASEHAGISAGLLHAFTGFDHLLAMLALGIWSAALPAQTQRQIHFGMPLVLIAAFLTGVLFAPQSVALADLGIALSLVMTGVLIANRTLPISAHAALLISGLCVALHGFAHSEALTGAVGGFAAGLVISSSLLLQAGRWIGQGLRSYRPQALILAGTLVSGAGVGLALA
ncbi:HupE/UreJ family protein [Parathalassolituus penaei]|uniref:HupE/UreJ family protein n=1 Tax=Parathalassolituus penaei TaxID=2997323 RepID=A0A9X3ECY4_9GAMM|nr:HupE/UreJ family protein [Parathalassolituus penaei]MCY0964871.1 HupE/UreJ family protein [Parathalassolituus penaei]